MSDKKQTKLMQKIQNEPPAPNAILVFKQQLILIDEKYKLISIKENVSADFYNRTYNI